MVCQEEIKISIFVLRLQIKGPGPARRHEYTVQCELRVNEFVEVGLLIIWLWLWFSFTYILMSTIVCVLRTVAIIFAPRSFKTTRMNTLLGLGPSTGDPNIDQFADMFLKPDGALILEIIEDNVSLNAASGVAKAAWQQYQSKRGDVTFQEFPQSSGSDKHPLVGESYEALKPV